jgi:hypothetical protein
VADAYSGLPLEAEVRPDSAQFDLNDNDNSNTYRDRDAGIGGTNTAWGEDAAPFMLWQQAADFQDGDSDDSDDVVDARAGRLKFSGTLSQSDLAG